MNEHEALDEQLSRAWEALSPPAGLEAKVRARLGGAGGSAAGRANAADRAPAGVGARLRALRASGGMGVGVGVVLLGLGFLAGYAAQPPASERLPEARAGLAPTSDPPSPGSAPASLNGAAAVPEASLRAVVPARGEAPPARDALPETQPPPGVAPAAAPTAKRSRPERRARGRARASEVARASQELVLLERAERAVRAHNPDLALVLAGELEDRYPGSQLHEERRAIEVMALCQAGSSLASELGERFARRYPGSVYGERIAAECVAGPTNRSALDIDGSEGGNNAKPANP